MIRRAILTAFALCIISGAQADDDRCRYAERPNVRVAACTRALTTPEDAESKSNYFSTRSSGYSDLKKYDLALADINSAIALQPKDEFLIVYRGEIIVV